MRRHLIASCLLAGICLNASANILGTGPDYLNGGPSQSAIVSNCHSYFQRVQVSSDQINPAPGIYNFTNAPNCNDAIVSNAIATGHALILDINGYPLWLAHNARAQSAWLSSYTTALVKHWGPQVQMSGGGWGCWNEPSFLTMFPGTNVSGAALQLCTAYNQIVTSIWSAATAIIPGVRLNVGKWDGFHPEYIVCDKNLGTMAMATWYTYHENDDIFGSPLLTGTTNINGVVTAFPWSVAAKYRFLRDIVPPGVKWGCDEMYLGDPRRAVFHAMLALLYGSSMEIYFLMPYQWPGGSADPLYEPSYGCTNGALSETSQEIIDVLTSP